MEDQSYKTEEEVKAEKTLLALQDQAHERALFRDWKNLHCTVRLLKWVDEQILDSKNQWLSADNRDHAEAIRLQAQAYTKTKNWILAQIKAGDVAAEGIKRLHDEGVELTGFIKPPTPK